MVKGAGRLRCARVTSSILLSAAMLLLLPIAGISGPSAAHAQVRISVGIAPPPLVVYEQPICPGDGYIWTPGYWAWDTDYYWVPGTWVLPPEVGFYWTPCYWGWGGADFVFYEGFWGPTIGFYGGIDYGFGYFGHGFVGGRWDNGHFFYNRAVANINVNIIHNTYNTRVNESVNHVSYNGGSGGINARPNAQEEAAAHDRHVPPVAAQTQHADSARSDPQQRFGSNHGAPPVAATARPGAFRESGAVGARSGGGATAGGGGARSNNSAIHPRDLPTAERPAAPNTGNAKLDKKYQKEQDKLMARQDQERQKLQQKQDQEHQQYTQQKASDKKTAKLEQRHQQQTQQLQQRHAAQVQQMQQRQAPAARGGGHR